jgi:hypothetical protein
MIDNVLGLHLPIVQLFVSHFDVVYDLSITETDAGLTQQQPQLNHAFSPELKRRKSVIYIDEQENQPLKDHSIKYYGSGLLWSDYFNNMLKCWEPLLEPFTVAVIYEEVHVSLSICFTST